MKKYLPLIVTILMLPLLVTSQSVRNAKEKVANYLQTNQNLTRSADKLQFEILSSNFDENAQIGKIQALQNINGITIKDAIITLAYNKEGKTFATNTFSNASAKSQNASINEINALNIAAKHHEVDAPVRLSVNRSLNQKDRHTVFNSNDFYASKPEVRLVYIQDAKSNELNLTWETQIYTPDRQHYFIDYVDATSGEVLLSEDKVLHCEFGHGLVYDASPEEQEILDAQQKKKHIESATKWKESNSSRVHAHEHCNHTTIASSAVVTPINKYLVLDLPAEAPNDNTANSNQTLITTSGDPIASPYGWTSLNGTVQLPYTHGNNVFSFYDPSPGPLGGIPNPAAAAQATSNNILGNQEFIYHWDLTQDPEYTQPSSNNPTPNRSAAIVNLFYQNNLIHDIFYNFGFTEAGRNFQFDNFGKGGAENDNVLAQAQDGGGTNNANMLTLQDGVNPQMQMYLWTAAAADELVQITSVSAPTYVSTGDKFNAIQGAIYSAINPYNLHENPVLNKQILLINNGCGDSKGCGLGAGGVGAVPCNNVTGAIVLIDRGDCSFVEKVDGAQKGGAAGVIIINNNSSSPDEVAAMGGTDPTGNTVTIPSVMVSYNTGLILKESLAEGVTIFGSLQQDNPPAPRRDGDFDNGIIAHEYGHGISSRTSPQGLTGGTLSGSEQGGEGWSDFYALYLTTTSTDLSPADSLHPNGVLPNKGIGTYVTYTNSDGPGIRPRKYSVDMQVNEYTFAGTTNGGIGIGNSAEISVPHGVGFIWCTMLWELEQALVDEYGFNDVVTYNPPSNDIQAIIDNNAGNNLALKLIQEGISLQKPSPTFLDMRDAIILADNLHYNGAHSCLIWKAFAKRGLGSDAINPTNNIGDERDGYATPCDPTQAFHNITIDAPVLLENESYLTYDILVENTTGAASYDIIATDVIPNNFTLTSVTGAPYVTNGRNITFTIAEIPANSSVILSITGYVLTENYSEIKESYSFETGSEGWTAVTGGINEFTRKTDGGQDGIAYFHTDNNGLTGANTTLESPSIPITGAQRQVRFYHKYDTDAGYDGGYLEYSTDGLTWAILPVQQNGYNAILDGLFNLTYTGPAFTGSISDYIESAALLPVDATNVRFVFAEDSGLGGGDGWFVDNIRIIDNPVALKSTAKVTDPISSGGRTYVDEVYTLVVGSTKPVFDVKPSMSITPGIVNGGEAPMRLLVDIVEMSGNNTTGPITVRISKNDYLGFTFDPTVTQVGGFDVDNSLFKFSENFLFWEFTTDVDILSNQSIRFGFTGLFDSNGSGNMPVSAKTKTVSKLENNPANNKDNESLNYSDQN